MIQNADQIEDEDQATIADRTEEINNIRMTLYIYTA